jgi:hypothetical protein
MAMLRKCISCRSPASNAGGSDTEIIAGTAALSSMTRALPDAAVTGVGDAAPADGESVMTEAGSCAVQTVHG